MYEAGLYILRLLRNGEYVACDVEGGEDGRCPSGGGDKERKGFGRLQVRLVFECGHVMKQAFDLSPKLYRKGLDLDLLILVHWGRMRHDCELARMSE